MSRASREAADRRIASLEKENERLRAVLIEHVVLAEYNDPLDLGENLRPYKYICQICNDEGAKPDDLIHMGDCPLYDADFDEIEAGTVD